MSAMRKWGAAALVAGLGTAILPVGEAEADVTTTKSDCITAWAVLMFDTPEARASIQRIISEDKRLSDEGYEERVAHKFELMLFDLTTIDGTAIVAHCGHGGTCNLLAQKLHSNFPTSQPIVVCTHDPPSSIENGRSM